MPDAARRGLLVFLLGLALIGGILAVDYWWLDSGPSTASNVSAGAVIGGPFTLIDQNGQTRRDTDFRGELMLVYFGYTYCPDACPAALQMMSTALDALGDRAKEVQPIFITVDPERDTVAQMKLYATNFHPRLLALTGTSDQVTAAASAYRVYVEKVKQTGKDDYLIDHSSNIFLMGRDGRLLSVLSAEATADGMAAAIKKYL